MNPDTKWGSSMIERRRRVNTLPWQRGYNGIAQQRFAGAYDFSISIILHVTEMAARGSAGFPFLCVQDLDTALQIP